MFLDMVKRNFPIHIVHTESAVPTFVYFPTFYSLSLLGDASGLFLSDLYARFIAKMALSESTAQRDCKSQCCVKVLDYFRLAFVWIYQQYYIVSSLSVSLPVDFTSSQVCLFLCGRV